MIQEASDEQPLDWSSVLTLAQSVEYHLLVIRDLATNVSKAVPHV